MVGPDFFAAQRTMEDTSTSVHKSQQRALYVPKSHLRNTCIEFDASDVERSKFAAWAAVLKEYI